MTNPFEKLFTPYKIGKMEVKNRIVMSPMGLNSADSDGTIGLDEIDYFEARARGGAGMIITGAQFLTQELAQGVMESVLEKNHVIPRLTELCESVHRYGTKIIAQLSCGTGRNALPGLYGEPPKSASAIPSTFNPDVLCHALTPEEIKEIMEQFRASAERVKKAGFDGIEIHAHAGYLIDQFMSPIWNKRDDEYGGTLEKRMRFPIEIVENIRDVIGSNMPILFRISLDHRFEGGRTLEESLEMIKLLEDAGVDALDVDAGSYETIDYIFPPSYLGDACMDYVCGPAREVVSIPILNSGNHTPETALRLIESGDADFAMMGRPLIADPDLPNKLLMNQREDIRPCIRCNQDCIGRYLERNTKVSCSVNPQVGFEKRFEYEKTTNPQHVVIIGAGPSGLEAARVAALEGHRVTLFEKEEKIGGQLTSAATPPFKKQLRELVKWYGVQLEKLGVEVKMSTEVKENDPILEEADHIIIGSGAVPVTPPIRGIENDNVIGAIEAHTHKDLVKGENIVITGGGLTGCDLALELAMEGKNVSIVEMGDELAPGLLLINAASLMPMLDEYNVQKLTSHKVLSFEKNGVLTKTKDGIEKLIEADTMINAFGMKPNYVTANKISEKYHTKTRQIGDSVNIAKVGEAVRSGFFAAKAIR